MTKEALLAIIWIC